MICNTLFIRKYTHDSPFMRPSLYGLFDDVLLSLPASVVLSATVQILLVALLLVEH